MFHRDAERLRQARERCDVLPLGSGALAATTLPIDRRAVAQRLHFKQLSANSMDAVSDRDFVVDIVAACSLLMVHLSRLSEELVLWCSSEFGYAELPDEFATGSSLMPQKKNPDVLELVRARAGRVNGDLMALLMTLKGLPLTYNRDLQEDKQPLFDAVDLAQASLDILAALLPTIRFNADAMRAAAADPALVATDIAEYLVQQGVPFRQAHGIVGSAVRQTIAQGRSLADLELSEWRALCDRCGPEIRSLFDQGALLERRDVPGGPGPRSVADQLARARAMLGAARD
jgi:argininosuccinate lyase